MNFYALDSNGETFFELLKNKDYERIIGELIDKIPTILTAIIIIIIGFIFSKIIGKLLVKVMEAKGVDSSVHSFIKTMVMFFVNLIFVLSAFSALKIDVSSFLTAIGAAGITAGLGFQSSISQFASGIQIIFNKPFKNGDYIDIGEVSGSVQEIKMMYTTLLTADNKRVIVPNSTITNSNIINYNAEKKRRIDFTFPLSYDADFAKAKEALLEVISQNDLILKTPEPLIAIKEHELRNVNIACLIWCDSNDYWDVYYYMQESVKAAFVKYNIPEPLDQLDVHIVKD
ncbi:MAG: mechanosensitive ion channel [Acutalibacteraceae bacterium]|nr:mechanosensitive ion channel [Acutalibacteraceae bacterium]